MNYILLMEILDCNNLIKDKEFKDYKFMTKSEKEIKNKINEFIENYEKKYNKNKLNFS